jgi:hypothetical protein
VPILECVGKFTLVYVYVNYICRDMYVKMINLAKNNLIGIPKLKVEVFVHTKKGRCIICMISLLSSTKM